MFFGAQLTVQKKRSCILILIFRWFDVLFFSSIGWGWLCGCCSETSQKQLPVIKQESQWNFSFQYPNHHTQTMPDPHDCSPQAYIKPELSDSTSSNKRLCVPVLLSSVDVFEQQDLRWFKFQGHRSSSILETWIQLHIHPLTKTWVLWQQAEGKGPTLTTAQRTVRNIACRHRQRKPS